MSNIPEVKLGLIAVSRSCFAKTLSERRRHNLADACIKSNIEIYECLITVENESDAEKAVNDCMDAGVNSIVVYLGNFGPESSETLIAKIFKGPVMFIAAAEGDGDLIDGRGDAYCGLLNCSYNLGLRNIKAYIPENPVGDPEELSGEIRDFISIARVMIGLKNLRIITFGPRPSDFLACNGPIKPLYEIGVDIEENSELDLLRAYNLHKGDKRIKDIENEMNSELGQDNKYIGIIPRLAQYELTLKDWIEEHSTGRYVALANKCWPAFQTEFGFVPCYVNGRLTASKVPVACEVDIYGALSEYIGACISADPVMLLDINNTVPKDIYDTEAGIKNYIRLNETFMGFHCGNASKCLLKDPHMGYQRIMKRDLEPEKEEPDITRGTMEGNIKPGDITIFRLQSTADCILKAYTAEGSVLDVNARSFGSIGVFTIPEMNRFYRHVLIQKQFPHHTAVITGHKARILFEVFKWLDINDISYNQPDNILYTTENPYRK